MTTEEVSSEKSLNVRASIYFCSRDEKFKNEKPYTLRYDPGGLFPATNIINEEHQVEIQNMRISKPPYDIGGFTFEEFASKMAYEDYENEICIQKVHIPEIEECLKTSLDATFVQVVDVAVGKIFPMQFINDTNGRYLRYEEGIPRSLLRLGILSSICNRHLVHI